MQYLFLFDCPSEMQALLVILGVIGAVALALLLVWRVLATIQVRLSSVGLSLKV